jgi:hypothetical protein
MCTALSSLGTFVSLRANISRFFWFCCHLGVTWVSPGSPPLTSSPHLPDTLPITHFPPSTYAFPLANPHNKAPHSLACASCPPPLNTYSTSSSSPSNTTAHIAINTQSCKIASGTGSVSHLQGSGLTDAAPASIGWLFSLLNLSVYHRTYLRNLYHSAPKQVSPPSLPVWYLAESAMFLGHRDIVLGNDTLSTTFSLCG